MKVEEQIEKARVLLGWPTNRKVLQLTNRFPEERWWERALAALEKALA